MPSPRCSRFAEAEERPSHNPRRGTPTRREKTLLSMAGSQPPPARTWAAAAVALLGLLRGGDA
jgi:hypothetical protein